MPLLYQSFTLTLIFLVSDAYKILGIFPYPSFSHQQPLHGLTLALSQHGHDVTVITTHPAENAPANYKQIDVSFTGPELERILPRKTINGKGTIKQLAFWQNLCTMNCDVILGSKDVQDFLKTNESKGFDAVIVETIGYGCFYGLVRHIGSPTLIGAIPTMMQTQNYFAIAFIYIWDYGFLPKHDAVASKYFGKSSVSIHADDRNVNLLISNCHWLFAYPQPYNPNILCVSGSHIKKETYPLPEKIQAFIGNSSEGFVYVSLGSQIDISDLTESMETTFIQVFRNLKLKVLWKYENENTAKLPSNVMTAKWLPQQDILAQRNIKLFVTQGGIQSFQEALYHAVPMLVIPFAVDQHYNAVNVVTKGLGDTISLSNFKNETLEQVINSILNNESYQVNTKRYSSYFKEHLEKSLERGVWWIEYVARHKGARHLRTASHSLNRAQGYLLDVILVTVFVIAGVCFALFKLIKIFHVV